MDRLKGKVAIITGTNQGIGRAIAEVFAKEGAIVVSSDLHEGANSYRGEGVEFEILDVSKAEDWTRVVGRTVAKHGGVDVLVNNAGIPGSYAPIHETDLDAWSKVIAVNQTGTFLGIRAVVPEMRKRGGGSIINLSSIWGTVGISGVAAYHASKGAVRNMTKNAAVTYGPDNIRANSIHPGIIATPAIVAQAKEVSDTVLSVTPLGHMGRPEDIAYGCAYLASDEASFVTGAELAIDGGYLAR